jgi:IBR domain, a half RING-finger domain/IBR domain/RING-type zinc-finger
MSTVQLCRFVSISTGDVAFTVTLASTATHPPMFGLLRRQNNARFTCPELANSAKAVVSATESNLLIAQARQGTLREINPRPFDPGVAVANFQKSRTFERNIPLRKSDYVSDGTYAKTMMGSTRAMFGAGGEVLELLTGERSRRLAIENLQVVSTKDSVKAVLELHFGTVEDVAIVEGRGFVTALVTMSTVQCADDVLGVMKLAVPTGLEPAHQQRVSAHSIPEARSSQGAHLSATVLVSSPYPSRLASASFRCPSDAHSAAEKVNGMIVGGRPVKCVSQPPTYGKGGIIYSLALSNLPEEIPRWQLKRMLNLSPCAADDKRLVVQPLLYSLKDFQQGISQLFRNHGHLVSFEISPCKPNSNKVYAFARFETTQESVEAVAKFHGKKQALLCGAPVYVEVINSIKYSVHTLVMDIVEPRIREVVSAVRPAEPHGYSIVRFARYQPTEANHSIQKFRIYGKDVKTLRSAKASVDKLLKGELLTSETGPIWVPEFSTPVGRRFLSSLNIDRKLVVFCDPRRRTLTVYGQADARERVKLEIQNHIKEIALHRHLIPLDNGDLATLLRGGLQTLRSRFGEGNIHFDIIAKTVEVNGSALDLEEASGLMKKARSSQQLAANITDSPDCPICYCDVENPVSFKCGHSYCQGCFDLYVESSLGSRSAPLSCATCNTKIDLSILRPLQSFDELLSIAFANYVSSNPTLYSYCPTPDCPQIYQIGSAGTVVQCSECLTHICTFCKIEWHEGMSCEEVQEDRDPTSQEKKNVQLMSELGIKPCPRCKTLIEKIAGCNHVTCSGCKTHLCWVCLRDFGDHGGSAVYDHMRKVHGTIG